MRPEKAICFYILLIAFLSVEAHAQTQKQKGYPEKDPAMDVLPGFINPPKGYGNVPFYWWNGDSLNKERLMDQLDILSDSAVDGFAVSYIHTTPLVDTLENKNGYGLFGMTEPGTPGVFTEEWWEIWNWFSGECGRRGLGVGLDDYTVGWVGNGYYPDELDTMSVFKAYKGELEIKVDTVPGGKMYEVPVPDNLVTIVAWPERTDLQNFSANGKIKWKTPEANTHYIYTITTKPGYVIHPEHGERLVDVYFNRFETKMDENGREGMNYFFQDELSYPIHMGSWSDDFSEEFLTRKGYDIIPFLPALKDDLGEITPKIRMDYCEVLMDLSEERYYKPVYDWHAQRGLIYGCDNLSRGKDPAAYIDYFRAMAWFTAPGNDAPARGSSFLETKVSSSISHVYNRPRTWLEAFHSMGWGSSGAWLTSQIDHHLIAGGNLVCMHGLYYSTHGGWWEWAPPDFHFRMPYWTHMKQWLKYTERMSYLLSQGSHVCDIAILYPTETIQAYPERNPDKTFATALALSNSGQDYDFIDFRSLREASVRDKQIQIADEKYKIIVLADIKAMHYTSFQQIRDFYRAGGIVLATGDLPKASSRTGENDPEINSILKEIFGVTPDEVTASKTFTQQTNPAGGTGLYIPEGLETCIPDLITPDFLPEKRVGKVLHLRIGEREVYMVTDVKKDSECFFRSQGKVELWDAHTGMTEAYPILRQDSEGTWLSMKKETGNSYLLVFSPGEPSIIEAGKDLSPSTYHIQLGGEWEVELLPTLNNKWGDYRFPAYDGMIGAEARSFKYNPASSFNLNWTKPEFDDSGWKEEIYGYGLQAETKADGINWQPVSFSWQYGVWDQPGSQGYHGLKGKIDDRFFILDKGANQQFRTYVLASYDGIFRIHIEGIHPEEIRIDNNQVKDKVQLTKGWHLLEVDYSNSEKVHYQSKTGLIMDNRKKSMVLLYPEASVFPEKPDLYAAHVGSRWTEKQHLLFDPFGGKYEEWNFRFESAPGLEEIKLTVYGNHLKIWLDGEEIGQENIHTTDSGINWNSYLIKLPYKKERPGKVAFSVKSVPGYQGTAILKEPVQLTTSTGLMHTGDWSKEGVLKYYSGGMNYKREFCRPEVSKGKRIMLDLGDVIATCEVKINDQSIGILINPPYEIDITSHIKEGNNKIEVLVYNTLSNHYQTIPTPYRGSPKAGLIGPVQIYFFDHP